MGGPGGAPVEAVGAVVLCGGTSRRFGGGDKTAAPLGHSTVLGTLVGALPTSWAVVCVGDARPVPRPAVWVRERPTGAGPLAGLAAGVGALTSEVLTVVALAGDQPFGGEGAARLVEALLGAGDDVDAVAARQRDGRPQLLLAAYRRDRLAPLLTGDVADAGVYRRLASLRVDTLPLGHDATLDVDTRDDLARAQAHRSG